MKRFGVFIALMLSFSIGLYSQERFVTAVKGDTVFIFLVETPPPGVGFHVERKVVGEGEFKRLTDKPVTGVVDPDEVITILGDEYESVARAVRAETPYQLIRRLRRDRFTAGVLSLVNHKVGKLLGRFFAAGGNKLGERYIYRLIFVDADGNEINKIEKEVLVREVKPKPPSNVKISPGDKMLTISWDYPKWKPGGDDLTVLFNVYRKSGGGKFEKIAQVLRLEINGKQVLEYTDESVVEGVNYTYRVTAVDIAGVESLPSKDVSIVLEDKTPPRPPTGLNAISGNMVVELIWHMSPELDVAYYNVYRSRGLDKEFKKINKKPIPADNPYFVDSVGVGGVQFFYSVSAVDSAGNESPRSNAISAVPIDEIPPGKPRNLKFEVKNRMVKLTWKAPKDKDIRGYYVYRGESISRVAKVSDIVTETVFIDSGFGGRGLNPGGKYVILVKTVDRSWNESEPAMVKVTIPDDEPPAPPSLYLENENGLAVRIVWNKSLSRDVAKYELYRVGKNDTLLGSFSPGDEFEYYDRLVKKGRWYSYKLVAIDTADNRSTPVVDSLFVRDFDAPPMPGYVFAKKVKGGVLITWEKVIDFDLAGYNIYRSYSATGIYTKINSSPVKDLKYLDSAGNENYWYKVKAVDTSGNESRYSEPVSVYVEK